MLRIGGYFVWLFGLVSTFLLVEGLIYGITGQIVSSLMLLSATIYTSYTRPARAAELVRQTSAQMAPQAT